MLFNLSIETIGIISSIVFSTISILISIKTLKQNSKMIEESTRPYMVMYLEVLNVQTPILFLILKNFGKNSAKILSFQTSEDLSVLSFDKERKPFKDIENTSIAPNQSISCALDKRNYKNIKNKFIHFNIIYESEFQIYHDEFEINLELYHNNLLPRASTDNKELKIISFTLQNILEKLL